MNHLLDIKSLSVQDILEILDLANSFKLEKLDKKIVSGEMELVDNFQNKHILIVGDILHSRVARSNLELLAKFGAKVTFVAPPTLLPSDLSYLSDAINNNNFQVEYDFDNALQKDDYHAIMMLRIQAERMNGDFFPSLTEYINQYSLTNERLKLIDPSTAVLHPAPVNRGLEISSEIVDSKNSLINHQIANGVWTRMACLNLLCGDKSELLKGKTIVNLFYENSTRTRFSFEAAEKKLSANIVNFSVSGSSVAKGESLKDTVLTLYAMGIDGIVMRHPHSGAAYRLATSNWIDIPVLNAGDGTHAHPTQSLLDAMTLREHFSSLSQIFDTTDNYGRFF